MWYARLAWFVVQGARRLTGAEPDEGSEEARYARICLIRPQVSWGVGRHVHRKCGAISVNKERG
jgi:hypothetical protein